MSAIPTALILGFTDEATDEEIASLVETWRGATKRFGLAEKVSFTVSDKKVTITSDDPERLMALAMAFKAAGARPHVVNEADLN